MPWFPDFVGALELARRDRRAIGRADPAGQYVAALSVGDVRDLEDVWPGKVVVHDPRSGEVRGHTQLRRFVRRSSAWLAERDARVETVASTAAGNRAVVELLAHLTQDGRPLAWPVAVVAESVDEDSVVFRSYFSRRAVDGQPHLRPPVLRPGPTAPDAVVSRYEAAVAAGDAEAAVTAFAPDGYLREPAGPAAVHRGAAELRSYFDLCFGQGGGIVREDCAVTDDGVRCAVEYNCLAWSGHDLPPQAGIAVHERGEGGLLSAVRLYDDVVAPASRPPTAPDMVRSGSRDEAPR